MSNMVGCLDGFTSPSVRPFEHYNRANCRISQITTTSTTNTREKRAVIVVPPYRELSLLRGNPPPYFMPDQRKAKLTKYTDPLYFSKGSQNEIANSDHERRFVETAILLHTNLYVMGQAREREDIVAAEIAKDKKAPMFLISTRTEKQISSGLGSCIMGLDDFRIIGGRWRGADR